MSRSPNKIPPLSPPQRRFVGTFPAVTAELGQAAPGGETSPDSSELWGLAHQLMLSGDHFGLSEITRAAWGLEKALRARSNRLAADAAIPGADLNAPIEAVIEQLSCLSVTATSSGAVALAHLVRVRVDGARQLAGAIAVDPVTGLAKRCAFEQQFEQLVGVMVRNRAVLSVVMVEMDGFRRFRDRHGVQAGDRLMRDLADEIRRRFCYSDLVCRYGQARFVLALPDSGLFAALMSIEKFKRQLAGPIRDSASRAQTGSAHSGADGGATEPDSGTGAACITLSGGVSTCRFSAGGRETPLRAGQLIESAAHALQIALEAGGNCVRTGDRRAA